MWPWSQPATSNQSFQPAAPFTHQHVHHVTPSASLQPQGGGTPTAYVGYQSSHFTPSGASGGTGELSRSHAGIGYGIPGMVSLSVPSPWNQDGLAHPTNVSPHSTDPHSIASAAAATGGTGRSSITSPVGLSYHPVVPHEELPGSLSHLGGPSVSPTSYIAPPANPTDTSSPTLHQSQLQAPSGQPAVVQEQVTLVSPNSASFAPPPQQQQQHSTSPVHQPHSLTSPHHHSYTSSSPGAVPPQAHHIHGSSPFSVDYLLHGNPPPNVVESLPGGSSGQGRLADGGPDPTYMSSQSGNFITGSGHGEMGQEIPAGGWSIEMIKYRMVGINKYYYYHACTCTLGNCRCTNSLCY